MDAVPPLLNEQYRFRSHYSAIPEEHTTINGNQVVVARGERRRLSPRSWSASRIARLVFIFAALVQMCCVVTMQGMIYQYGGDGRALPEYKHCLSDDLQMAIDCSEKTNWTISALSFGKDKPVYVGFIISLTVYNAMLCIYALFGKQTPELVSFLITNVLTMIYACFEAWQFRPFGPNCSDLPIACWLAIGTVAVLFVFTTVFVLLLICVCKDFSRKAEKDVNHDDQLTKYYNWYNSVSSGVKLLILFTVVFSVAQLSLLLTPENYEFELTIILVVVAIVAYFVIQLTIHYNSFTGHFVIVCAGVLLFAYYLFKIVRFARKDCPICVDLTGSVGAEYKELKLILETCTDNDNATLGDVEIFRSIQFDNLAIFATANALTTIVVFVMYLGFWCCLPGDRLIDYFQNNPSWIVRIMRYRRTGNEPLYVQIKKVTFKDVIAAIAEAFGYPIKDCDRTLEVVG